MELKEFIKQVLSDIALAVKESQDELEGVAVINAPSEQSGRLVSTSFYERRLINFDIAVSASEETDRSVGVSVLSAISGKGSSNTTNQLFSRISFSIPVYLSRGQLQGFDKLQCYLSSSQVASYDEPKGRVT